MSMPADILARAARQRPLTSLRQVQRFRIGQGLTVEARHTGSHIVLDATDSHLRLAEACGTTAQGIDHDIERDLIRHIDADAIAPIRRGNRPSMSIDPRPVRNVV